VSSSVDKGSGVDDSTSGGYPIEVPGWPSGHRHRLRHIDTAFAAVLLSADTIVGGLPSDRLTISGPLGEIILANPPAQSEWAAGSAGS
jgi:hypothetical protein